MLFLVCLCFGVGMIVHMFSGVCLVCIVYVCYAHACLVSRRNTIDDDDDDDDINYFT